MIGPWLHHHIWLICAHGVSTPPDFREKNGRKKRTTVPGNEGFNQSEDQSQSPDPQNLDRPGVRRIDGRARSIDRSSGVVRISPDLSSQSVKKRLLPKPSSGLGNRYTASSISYAHSHAATTK